MIPPSPHSRGKEGGMETKVIGTVATAQGGRAEVTLEHWSFAGKRYVTVRGPNVARDFSYAGAAIKFAKRVFAHPSNAAEWARA